MSFFSKIANIFTTIVLKKEIVSTNKTFFKKGKIFQSKLISK